MVRIVGCSGPPVARTWPQTEVERMGLARCPVPLRRQATAIRSGGGERYVDGACLQDPWIIAGCGFGHHIADGRDGLHENLLDVPAADLAAPVFRQNESDVYPVRVFRGYLGPGTELHADERYPERQPANPLKMCTQCRTSGRTVQL